MSLDQQMLHIYEVAAVFLSLVWFAMGQKTDPAPTAKKDQP